MDDPDLSIRAERLIDDGPGEIKTVVADSTMYTSGVWLHCMPGNLQGRGLAVQCTDHRPL